MCVWEMLQEPWNDERRRERWIGRAMHNNKMSENDEERENLQREKKKTNSVGLWYSA